MNLVHGVKRNLQSMANLAGVKSRTQSIPVNFTPRKAVIYAVHVVEAGGYVRRYARFVHVILKVQQASSNFAVTRNTKCTSITHVTLVALFGTL